VKRDELIKKLMEKHSIGKEVAEKMADDIISMHEESVSGLKDNKDVVLKEKKDYERKLKAFKDAGLESAEEYLTTKKKLAELEEKDLLDKNNYQEVLNIKTKEWETEKAKLVETTSKLQQSLDENIIQRDLVDGLVNAGVTKSAMDIVKKAMLTDTKVVEIDGKRVAVINEEPVSKYLESWKGTEAAQPFIAAPVNGGAGSTVAGSSDSKSGEAVSEEEFYKSKFKN
jgi:hypothetical protein